MLHIPVDHFKLVHFFSTTTMAKFVEFSPKLVQITFRPNLSIITYWIFRVVLQNLMEDFSIITVYLYFEWSGVVGNFMFMSCPLVLFYYYFYTIIICINIYFK